MRYHPRAGPQKVALIEQKLSQLQTMCSALTKLVRQNFLGLVTQVVGDDVDLATCRLTHHDLCKEIDELGAGVACAGFSQHLSGF
jgi:hypothetical protein